MKGKHNLYVCLLFIHLVNKTQRILTKKQGLNGGEKKEPGSFTDSGERERALPS